MFISGLDDATNPRPPDVKSELPKIQELSKLLFLLDLMLHILYLYLPLFFQY